MPGECHRGCYSTPNDDCQANSGFVVGGGVGFQDTKLSAGTMECYRAHQAQLWGTPYFFLYAPTPSFLIMVAHVFEASEGWLFWFLGQLISL